MRTVGARFPSGPNIHDDSSGVVIGTDLVSLPPAGQPSGGWAGGGPGAGTVRPETAVAGRKRLYLTASGKRTDAFVRATGRALAGSFDAYVCTNSPLSLRPDPQAVPGLLRDGIVEGGVSEEDVVCIPSDEDALR